MEKRETLKVTIPDPWKTRKIYLTLIALAFIMIATVTFFLTVGEISKPVISVTPQITHIGERSSITAIFEDKQSGLSQIKVIVTQGKETHTLINQTYRGESEKKKTLAFVIEPRTLKLSDGPATISLFAYDRSLWRNEGILHVLVTIDAHPPQLSLVSPITHINLGGAGVVGFRVSKPVNIAGVKVNEEFFPAYPAPIAGAPGYIAYFALPIDALSQGNAIKLYARDLGGNEASAPVAHLVLKRKFRHDRMPLSEQFLNSKMPEFAQMNPALQGKSPLEIFIYVNSEMRKENNAFIRNICSRSEAKRFWEGAFLRMKNASTMARFGDQRTYTYQGKEVGTSVHEGVDLASTANAPIEAANNGIVVFTGSIGIYGQTVIIDHGQGVFSLYAHLASITTQKGKMVKKGDPIGTSGQTGLAGGDHLHFSILVNGHFVNPEEWWDAHWIKDNVEKKLGEVS